MKQTLQTKSLFTALMLFVFTLGAMAQGLIISVVPTDAQCSGEGALAFNVTSGLDTTGTLAFYVYSGTTPTGTATIISTPPYTLGSLSEGDYTVVAIQTVNNIPVSSPPVTVHIGTTTAAPVYLPVISNVQCGNDGSVRIETVSGIAQTYQLVAGTGNISFPAQISNTFSGLGVGTYTVIVKDICGNLRNIDITLTQNSSPIYIGNYIYLPGEMAACGQIVVGHNLTTDSGQTIAYPLTLQYTVTSPTGVVSVLTQQVQAPTQPGPIASIPLPYFNGQSYSYNLLVTDRCGNTFNLPNQVVNYSFTFEATPNYGHCKQIVELSNLLNFVAPVTVDFTQFPPGFDQTLSNASDPVFTSAEITPGPIVYGDALPDGPYTVQITDACGSVFSVDFIIDKPEANEYVVDFSANVDCGATVGQVSASISPAQTNFLSVNIVAPIPTGYTGPTDISSGINTAQNKPWEFSYQLPVNDEYYHFEVEDECGHTLTDSLLVQPNGSGLTRITVTQRPGCDVNYGSVFIVDSSSPPPAPPTPYISAVIPAGGGPALWNAMNPGRTDISANIATTTGNQGNGIIGAVYMNGLPEGDYTIELMAADGCGPRQFPFHVDGLHFNVRESELDLRCNAYTITITEEGGNYAINPTYWLQKRLPGGGWGHPDTGVAYPGPAAGEDTPPLPVPANSFRLNSPFFDSGNIRQPGVTTTGYLAEELRVIQTFSIYANGTSNGDRCIIELENFSFNGAPVIEPIDFISTSATTVTAIVTARGVGPFQYRISAPAAEATTFDASNVFTNLTTGTIYTFEVIDRCFDTDNRTAAATPQPPLTITQTGGCEGQLFELSVPNYPYLTYNWTKTGDANPSLSNTSTYRVNPFNNTTTPGEYVVNIVYTDDPTLFSQELRITVIANDELNAGLDNNVPAICADPAALPLNLNNYLVADPTALHTPDPNGVWTDATGAMVTNTFNIAAITTTQTVVFNYSVTDICGAVDVAVITFTINETPAAPVVNLLPIVCEGAPLVLTATSTTPGATFTWSTPNGNVTGSTINIATAQLSDAGQYTVTAAIGTCSSAPVSQTIVVTALVNAGADNNVAPLCSNATTNVIDLKQYLVAPFTAGGTFTVGPLNADPTAFDGVDGFDTANLSGTFDFIYSITACGITDTATITFTINPTPVAPVATALTPLVCENGTIQLTTPVVTAGDTYAWYKDGGTTVVSTDREPNIPATIAAAGNYTVTVTTALGCTSVASAPANVVVTPLPQFTLGGDTVLCPGQPTTITVNGANFNSSDVTNYTYVWSVDGVVDTSLTGGTLTGVTITDDTVYSVTIATVSGGCATTQNINLTLNRDPFTVVLDADCVNDRFILSITNIAEIGTVRSIVWSGPEISDTSNSTSVDITDKPKNSTYEVTVTNADGCVKVQSITVTSTSCMIPRGISPEEVDGKNDFFDLTNLGVQNLQIFNRYGLQVYEKNNYTKEWYGQSDKGDLPTGTYFYVVKTAEKQVTGWVYIQRNN